MNTVTADGEIREKQHGRGISFGNFEDIRLMLQKTGKIHETDGGAGKRGAPGWLTRGNYEKHLYKLAKKYKKEDLFL